MTENTGKKSGRTLDRVLNWLLIGMLLYFAYRYAGLLYPSTRVASPEKAQVVMYATKWCPFCIEARAFFARNGINYFEYNIDKSTTGRRQFIALGGQGVPLFKIGNKTVSGMQRQRLRRLLLKK